MTTEHQDLAIRETVDQAAVIKMNRENKRNALNGALLNRLTQLVAEAGIDETVSGIILTGGQRCFSAGADLTEAVNVRTPAAFEEFAHAASELTRVIEENPKPVLAVIHGPCMTGGLEIALACDERIVAHSAVFAMTSARIGSVAGFGGTQRLPRLIGAPAAKKMMFTGCTVDANTAHTLGLVDQVTDEDEALETAISRTKDYASVSPLSIALTKRAVNVGTQQTLASGLQLEHALCARAFASHDKEEGMRAFLEKRVAHFKGL